MKERFRLEVQDSRPRKLRKVGPDVGERFLASMTWGIELEQDRIDMRLWEELWAELDGKKLVLN